LPISCLLEPDQDRHCLCGSGFLRVETNVDPCGSVSEYWCCGSASLFFLLTGSYRETDAKYPDKIYIYCTYRVIQYGKLYSRVCFSATNDIFLFYYLFVEIFVTFFSTVRLNEQLNNFEMVFQSELTKKLQDVSRRLEETSSKLHHFFKI
jgi:hypothetical protein